MYTSTTKSLSALTAIALLTATVSAQSTTSSSSFNWDSLISAADTATTTFDLYTTAGSLGPGVADTTGRPDLFTSAPTPIAGPIGNGTVANGTTAAGNGTTTMGGVGGGGSTGGVGGGAGGGSSGSAGVSAPVATGNVAASVGGLWVEGAGLLVGLGALMAAL